MANCELELQKAVYALLSQDSPLATLGAAVYQHVPEQAAYPYVVIEVSDSNQEIATELQTRTISVAITAFCRDRSSQPCLDIVHRVGDVLDNADLTLAGCTLRRMVFVSSEVRLQPGGLTYRGTVISRARVRINGV